MDFQQRYTGDDYFFEMEEKFLEEIETLPPLYGAGIIMQLDKLATEIHEEKKYAEEPKRFGMVAGVVALENPLFFSVQYINSRSMFPLFYKFNVITSDEYLDYINLNKTIKNGTNTNKKLTN